MAALGESRWQAKTVQDHGSHRVAVEREADSPTSMDYCPPAQADRRSTSPVGASTGLLAQADPQAHHTPRHPLPEQPERLACEDSATAVVAEAHRPQPPGPPVGPAADTAPVRAAVGHRPMGSTAGPDWSAKRASSGSRSFGYEHGRIHQAVGSQSCPRHPSLTSDDLRSGARSAGSICASIPAVSCAARRKLAMNEGRERPAVGLTGIAHTGPIP